MRLRHRASLLACSFAGLTGCGLFASLTSQTVIEPRAAFLLGGNQGRAFHASVRNVGPVPVTLFNEAAGVRRAITTLAPDASAEADFAAKEMAVVANATDRTAMVKLVVHGTADLAMRYDSARSPR